MSDQPLGLSDYLKRLCMRAWGLDPRPSGMSRILRAGTICETVGMTTSDVKEAAKQFAAGTRTVYTPEALRRLPGGTILHSLTGQAVWLDPLMWPEHDHVTVTGEKHPLTVGEALDDYGPLTVLYKPERTSSE